MRLVFGLVLVAGVGLAGSAVYMAQNYIGQYESALQQERAKQAEAIKTKPIYVATRPITYGEQIMKEDVALAEWPEAFLPESYFDAETPFYEEGSKLLRVAVRPIEMNEPFMAVKVS